jgi:nicotinate-nucleotide adenylyltransferase
VRIGLLGGTFDPPHRGHLAAAEAARDALHLDRVLLVVANNPWQKSPHRVISAATDRLAMVTALAHGADQIEPSRIEIDRGGPSYTIDTVNHLLAVAAEGGVVSPVIYVIIGADLVETLPTWDRADDLAQLVTLAVVSRPHSPKVSVPEPWRAEAVDGPAVDASSSQIRQLVADGANIDQLVPPDVVHCIHGLGLYAGGR